MKARTIAVALGALGVALLPAGAANADPTIGGQTVRVGDCEVTLPSVTWDPVSGELSSTEGHMRCPEE